MAEIISWATAKELIRILEEQNALVSGMTVAEAAAASGFSVTAGGMYVKTLLTSSVAEASIAGSASAAAEVATGGVTTTAANLVLYEGVGGQAVVGGLGSVALPIAAGATAAVGGYLIGNEIYERNSTFLDELMFPFYDFVTGNHVADTLKPEYAPSIPFILNTLGQTFMHSKLIDIVKDFLDSKVLETLAELVHPSPGSSLTSPFNTNNYSPTNFDKYGWSTTSLSNQVEIDVFDKTKIHNVFYASSREPTRYINSIPVFTIQVVMTLKYYKGYYSNEGLKLLRFGEDVTRTFAPGLWIYTRGGGDPTPETSILHSAWCGEVFLHGYTNEFGEYIPGGFHPSDHIVSNDLIYASDGSLIGENSGTPIADKGFIDLIEDMTFGTKVLTGGLPSYVNQYIPGTSPEPLKMPKELPSWKPVVIPRTVPTKMPEPAKTPDTDPDPDKLTPFIPAIQPKPGGIPITIPSTRPGSQPAPDPAIDPSNIPILNPDPDVSIHPVKPINPQVDPSVQPVPPVVPSTPTPTPPVPVDTGTTPVPSLPYTQDLSSSATGLLHVYNPTGSQVNAFGTWLWTTFSGDIIDTITKLFNSPMDAVIGLHELYCHPRTEDGGTIKAGYLDSHVASRLVNRRYTEFSCGSVAVPEYWSNYLDYSPYTKTFCYLPFIGVVELNSDDIVGHGVQITYRVDCYTGACIALITTARKNSAESITYEFTGNCAVEIPITSGMMSSVQGALMGAGIAALSAATAGVGGLAIAGAAAVGGARGASNNKNNVQHSSAFGANYGAMGVKKPFMIIKRPQQKVVPGYNKNYGYPAHKMVVVSECSGYLKAIEVFVVSPTATEDEKKMIEEQLKNGIFVN